MYEELLPKIVILLGFIPMLVSATRKEIHYTQFWDAFWNLYGLILVLIGIAFDSVSLADMFLPIIAK